jgi:hypothetical protein
MSDDEAQQPAWTGTCLSAPIEGSHPVDMPEHESAGVLVVGTYMKLMLLPGNDTQPEVELHVCKWCGLVFAKKTSERYGT